MKYVVLAVGAVAIIITSLPVGCRSREFREENSASRQGSDIDETKGRDRDSSDSDEHRLNNGMKIERGIEEGMKMDELQRRQLYDILLPGEIELDGPMRIRTYIEGDAA